MVENLRTRAMTLELKGAAPEELDAAADFSFLLIVACPCGCDHSAAPFKILAGDQIQIIGSLPALTGKNRDTAEITVTTPEQIGEFEWTFVVPMHEIDGLRHEEGSLSFSFKTKPHETSLAVWDNPSPVVIGERYGLKVAARCTAACVLTGKPIEIRDEAGERVAGSVLGDTPLPGTTALYWTDIGVVAPVEPGVFSWSLHFPAADRPLPHGASSCSFTFVVVPPPEHLVAVKVVERDTEAPIHDAHVRLGVYRGSTDATGMARFAVAGTEHRLFVSKPGYEVPERTIDVKKNGHVQVEAAVLPMDDPDAYWQG